MTLDYLAIKYGTDKSSEKHNYTEPYEFMFREKRQDVRSVLEFGAYKGSSLKMWADYFFNAEIHGVDVRKQIYDVGGLPITHHVLDCTTAGVRTLTKSVNPDIVIDDAGHGMNQHQVTFEFVWPLLKSGAWYVIEDLHTCYATEHGGWKGHPGYDVTPEVANPGKFGRTVDWLAELSHSVNFRPADKSHGILKTFPYFQSIKSLHFYRSIVFIEKK